MAATSPSSLRTTRKGEQTRLAIVNVALDLASRAGLEGITIGLIAERMNMSKSGVFSHFGSREDLQISVCRLYHDRFREKVFMPSLAHERGLPRLQAMFLNWIELVALEVATGCIYISGAVEYDDRPGDVRNALLAMVNTWQEALHRCVVQAMKGGQLPTNMDPTQLVYEMYSLVLGFHHEARFLKSANSKERALAGFERLINSYRNGR